MKHDPLQPEPAAVAKYEPMVRSLARRLKIKLPLNEFDDLFSDGMLGLLLALRGTGPCEEEEFQHYASKRIRGAMYDGIRRKSFIKLIGRERGVTAQFVGEEALEHMPQLGPDLVDVVFAHELIQRLQLTDRQWQVLVALTDEQTMSDLALEHGMSQENFWQHQQRLFKKCNSMATSYEPGDVA